jgi:putative MATE family efflux protein
MKKESIDMLHGALAGKLILFALPIALSSMLQQLFNAADTAVVGHFADSDALAAVGTNGEIVALIVTVSAGLSVGANVLIARFIGEGARDNIAAMIHTAITLAIVLGFGGLFSGLFLSRPVLVAINTPASVLPLATRYLRLYFAGYPFLLLYDFGSAILRAQGDSRRPFLALSLSGLLNVLLNLFFVIVCNLGVAGVAIATDISTAFSAFLVLLWIGKIRLRLHRKHLRTILAVGIPAAIQGAVFCFANIFVQACVNSFGAIATAGSTIAMNFEYFGYYMITAFGQTATTFTSQNHAAGLKMRCRKILLLCILFSTLFSALITVPLTVFRAEASRLFSVDPAVIHASCVRIMLILILEPICSFYEVPAGALRGMGHSTLPAVFTVIGTCLFRIIWIFTVFAYYNTQESLFLSFPLSWVLTILLVNISYITLWRKIHATFPL